MLPVHRLQVAATALKADVFSLTYLEFDGMDKTELQRALLKAEQLNAAECEFAAARQEVIDSLIARITLIEKGKDDAQNITTACCCPCHEFAGAGSGTLGAACDNPTGTSPGTDSGSAKGKNRSSGCGN